MARRRQVSPVAPFLAARPPGSSAQAASEGNSNSGQGSAQATSAPDGGHGATHCLGFTINSSSSSVSSRLTGKGLRVEIASASREDRAGLLQIVVPEVAQLDRDGITPGQRAQGAVDDGPVVA